MGAVWCRGWGNGGGGGGHFDVRKERFAPHGRTVPKQASSHHQLQVCRVSRIHMLESTRGGMMTGEEDTAGIVEHMQSSDESVGAKSGKGSMCGETDTNGWVSPETALHRGGVVGWVGHSQGIRWLSDAHEHASQGPGGGACPAEDVWRVIRVPVSIHAHGADDGGGHTSAVGSSNQGLSRCLRPACGTRAFSGGEVHPPKPSHKTSIPS